MAEGKCFRCKEPGHLARNCPKDSFIKSDKSRKAPGLSSYRIELEMNEAQELDELQEAAENIPQLHQINLGVISFDNEDFMDVKFPFVRDLVYFQ